LLSEFTRVVMITNDITNMAVAGVANLRSSRRSGVLTRLRPQDMTSFRRQNTVPDVVLKHILTSAARFNR
jgi:hypothetical protein